MNPKALQYLMGHSNITMPLKCSGWPLDGRTRVYYSFTTFEGKT